MVVESDNRFFRETARLSHSPFTVWRCHVGTTQAAYSSSSAASFLLHQLPARSWRAGLWVDWPNAVLSAQEVGARINWPALVSDLRRVGDLTTCVVYLADHPGNAVRTSHLQDVGFTVECKPVKRSGERFRADLDVNLAVGVVRYAATLDFAFVVCGDVDLLPAWQYAEELGTKIVVLGFPHSTSQVVRQRFAFISLDPWLLPATAARAA